MHVYSVLTQYSAVEASDQSGCRVEDSVESEGAAEVSVDLIEERLDVAGHVGFYCLHGGIGGGLKAACELGGDCTVLGGVADLVIDDFDIVIEEVGEEVVEGCAGCAVASVGVGDEVDDVVVAVVEADDGEGVDAAGTGAGGGVADAGGAVGGVLGQFAPAAD